MHCKHSIKIQYLLGNWNKHFKNKNEIQRRWGNLIKTLNYDNVTTLFLKMGNDVGMLWMSPIIPFLTIEIAWTFKVNHRTKLEETGGSCIHSRLSWFDGHKPIYQLRHFDDQFICWTGNGLIHHLVYLIS